MSKLVESFIGFWGRRSSKDASQETAEPGRRKKAILKADSFVFLPGECRTSGAHLWGEVITPRTVGLPSSSPGSDYSVLRGTGSNAKRKGVQSVLVDGSGQVVSRRLSGSVVLKTHKSMDEVGDASLEAFLREFEEEGDLREGDFPQSYSRYSYKECYHSYAQLSPKDDGSSDPRYVYDRLVHLPAGLSHAAGKGENGGGGDGGGGDGGGGGERRHSRLDLRDGGRRRRRASSSSAEQLYATPTDQLPAREAVNWRRVREQLEMATFRGSRS